MAFVLRTCMGLIVTRVARIGVPGDNGIQGPPGPAGPQGPTGPMGPSGSATTVNTLRPVVGVNSSASTVTLLRAYFMYMGLTTRALTVTQLRLTVPVAGSGAQTAEAGLYSSPGAPAGALQDLTRIGPGATFTDSLASTGHKSVTLNQAVPEGTHLWAAFRCNMATSAPQIYRSMFDDGGLVTHCYGAVGALTSAGSILAGSLTIPTFNTSGLNLVLVTG